MTDTQEKGEKTSLTFLFSAEGTNLDSDDLVHARAIFNKFKTNLRDTNYLLFFDLTCRQDPFDGSIIIGINKNESPDKLFLNATEVEAIQAAADRTLSEYLETLKV